MKTQAVRFVAASLMLLLSHASGAHAITLDDLMGFNSLPSRAPTYRVTAPDQSQHPVAVRAGALAYPAGTANRALLTNVRQPDASRTAYRQSDRQASAMPRQTTSAKPLPKESATQRTAAKNSFPSAMTTPTTGTQPNSRIVSSSQPNKTTQSRNVARQRTIQPAPSGYYSPYQAQYSPRSYYQGGWCPPGRS